MPPPGRGANSPSAPRWRSWPSARSTSPCRVKGRRYDMGGKYGLLFGQLALALDGSERDEVLAQLVELLAARKA